MDATETIVVTFVVVIVTVLPAVVMCVWYWDSVKVKIQSGVNDDDTAATTFTDVLLRARRTLVIYDDGNKMKGTIYDDPRVTEAVREQFRANGELVIRCFFNDNEDLDLIRSMRAEYPDRFKVWYRRGARPVNDVHYKIADGGTVGHLSSHEHGRPERQYKLLDCAAAKPRTRRMAFGRYLAQFETNIKEHSMAAA